MRVIDLSQSLSSESLSYPGDIPGIQIRTVNAQIPGMHLSTLTHLDPHLGTHIDAPLHFTPGGRDVSDLPPLVLPAALVTIHASPIAPADLPKTGLQGCAILFSTGWEAKAGSADYFAGYPWLTPSTAQALVNAGVALVGIDTPSVDPSDQAPATPDDPGYPAHRILLQAGIPIVEGLCNLPTLLVEQGTILFAAFPLKIAGLEGSPVRAIALLSDPLPSQD